MKMTGGEAIVQSLVAHGVEVVFGIPGTHNLAVYDALLDTGIEHVTARHEQGAAFMADGYARASGKVGVCFCTSGPALLNAATPLGTAYADSSPVLCIASQIPRAVIGQEKGYIHECRDQLGCLRPVAAFAERADFIADIPPVMQQAFVALTGGRPRPAVVEVPCDTLDDTADLETLSPIINSRLPADQAQVEVAAAALRAAEAPLIWCGGGAIASNAATEIVALAERLQAPVCQTVLGRGIIPDDHPLSVGTSYVHPAGQEFFQSFDTLLAVGSRFTPGDTNDWQLPLPRPLIHIDIDPVELGRNVRPDIPLLGDARETVAALNHALASHNVPEQEATAHRINQLHTTVLEDCRETAPLGVELVEALKLALPVDAVLVSDLTLAAYWCRRLLPIYEPRNNIYPWGFCTLGFGLPAGIGAKFARPDNPVVVLSGDGGFLFNCQELAVAVEFDLPLVVLVFNNGGYGVLRPQQIQRYDRTLGTELPTPDFVALAASFGVAGQRIDSLDQLESALVRAIEADKPYILEITADIPVPVMEPGMKELHGL